MFSRYDFRRFADSEVRLDRYQSSGIPSIRVRSISLVRGQEFFAGCVRTAEPSDSLSPNPYYGPFGRS